MNLHSDKKITKLSFLKSLKKFFFSTISFLLFPPSAVLIVLYLAVHLPSNTEQVSSESWPLRNFLHTTRYMNAISKDRDDVRSREGNPRRRLFVIKISGNALLITARDSSTVFNETLPYLLRVPWNSCFIIRKKWKSELSRESRMRFDWTPNKSLFPCIESIKCCLIKPVHRAQIDTRRFNRFLRSHWTFWTLSSSALENRYSWRVSDSKLVFQILSFDSSWTCIQETDFLIIKKKKKKNMYLVSWI